MRMKKKWVFLLLLATSPFAISILLNSGCGSKAPTSTTSSSSNSPFLNASGTPCVVAFGNYDTAGIGLTPIPANAYVAVRFASPAAGYSSYSAPASVGQAGIYAANSGSGPETIELGAYGNSSSVGGPLYGGAVSIEIPASSPGAWQLVDMPNISYTDLGPDVYLAAHAVGADLSIGAKGTGSQYGIGGTKTSSIGGYLPTPTATITSAPNFEMFVKSCP